MKVPDIAKHPTIRGCDILWFKHLDGPQYDTFACSWPVQRTRRRAAFYSTAYGRTLEQAMAFAKRKGIPWPANWPTPDDPRRGR